MTDNPRRYAPESLTERLVTWLERIVMDESALLIIAAVSFAAAFALAILLAVLA